MACVTFNGIPSDLLTADLGFNSFGALGFIRNELGYKTAKLVTFGTERESLNYTGEGEIMFSDVQEACIMVSEVE